MKELSDPHSGLRVFPFPVVWCAVVVKELLELSPLCVPPDDLCGGAVYVKELSDPNSALPVFPVPSDELCGVQWP